MDTWLVLLRGINVGGKRPVPMADLREAFVEMGYRDPVTYIQSGNVVVGSARAKGPRTVSTLERRLEAAFGHDLRLVVRDLDEVSAIVRGIPRAWDPSDATMRHNVLFLTDRVDGAALGPTLPTKPGIESLTWGRRALYWSAPLATITRSEMVKLSAHPDYAEMTIRNLRTTLAVHELMRSHPSAGGSRRPRR
jgi:uncharacterized protein (DUF1697 family)